MNKTKYQDVLDELRHIIKIHSIDFDEIDVKRVVRCLNLLGELVDKETPKMVKKLTENAGDCPNCDRIVHVYNHCHCPYCGQALNWS